MWSWREGFRVKLVFLKTVNFITFKTISIMRTIKKLLSIALAIIFSSMLLFTGCDSKDEDVIKIGAIIFLTGPASDVGKQILQGAQLAEKIINENGGINGRRVKIIFEDSQNTTRGALNAFQKLLFQDVQVILSTGDIEFRALNEQAERHQIPIVGTVSTGGTNLPNRSSYLLRFSYSDFVQTNAMAKFAIDSLNINNVSVLYPNNAWGIEARDLFVGQFERYGGNIINAVEYNMANIVDRNQIISIMDNRNEAIFIKGWGTGFNSAIRQLRENRFNGYFLSDPAMSLSYTIEQTAPANDNSYFTNVYFDTNSDNEIINIFLNRYLQVFDMQPDFWAGFAYDAVFFIARAIEKGEYKKEDIKRNMLLIEDLSGVLGNHSFDENGDLDFSMSIFRIVDGNIELVVREFSTDY